MVHHIEKHTERQLKSPSGSERVYCSRRRHPNQYSVTVSKLVETRLDKYIIEIQELGIGLNMTQISELTVKFSDVASTTSPITWNTTKVGVFWWSSFTRYSLSVRIPAPSNVQLCASAPGSSIPTGPLQAYLQKDQRKCWWYPVFFSKYCEIKSGKTCRISDPLT